jgi:hypothetical protein
MIPSALSKYHIKRIIANVSVVSFGFLYVGYSIGYVQVLQIHHIHKLFHISISVSLFQGILSAIIYAGAAFGSALSNIFITKFSRK